MDMNHTKKFKTIPRRYFKKSWELEFFVIENGNKAICLVENCGKKSEFKKDVIKTHFNAKHSDLVEILSKLSVVDLAKFKIEKFQELKSIFEAKQTLELQIVNTNSNLHKLASYKVAHLIAKNLKYTTDGEFVKKCMLTVCKTIFPQNFDILEQIEKVPLERTTISKRISKISENLKDNLKLYCSNLKYFSICLDETNDKVDQKHLAIFIRGANDNFEVIEELLDLVQMPNCSTGEEIFKQLEIVFNKFDLDLNKFISITCDGARNLQGNIKGLIAFIKNFLVKNYCKNEFFNFHCLIHQENLCCKGIDIDQVLNKVVQIVKKLKKSGNLHREFKSFLEDECAEFSDVLYYTEIRWLSRSKCLKRFFDLLAQIDKFFLGKDEQIVELSNPLWKFKLAFLVDITTILNDLNLSLQGKNEIILDSFNKIKMFILKLNNIIEEVEEKEFFHFLNAEKIYKEYSLDKNENFVIGDYLNFLRNLLSQFELRFLDFKDKNIFDLFLRPFELKKSQLPIEFQSEVCELVKNKFEIQFNNCSSVQEKMIFFKNLPENYIYFKSNALKILSMFGSSYLCEQFFSLLKFRKTQYSSLISSNNLQSCLRIASSNFEPNYENLLNK